MSTLPRLTAIFLALLLASCASSILQPANTWTAETLEQPLHDVQVIKYLPKKISAKGSGIIVHSSKEHGTYILTCGHIACYSPDLKLQSSIEETANNIGKRHSCPPGTPMSARIHSRSVKNGSHTWKEWAEFDGTVEFGVFELKKWPYSVGTYKYTATESPRPEILDVALIHVRTGHEPLQTAEIGGEFWPSFGTAAGISYTTNRPESNRIFAINESVFFFDGHYSSGFGVYDSNHRLSGVYVSKMGLDSSVLEIGNRVFKPTEQYHFVPITTIRSALNSVGFGWVLD
jgi:hypothetical protein